MNISFKCWVCSYSQRKAIYCVQNESDEQLFDIVIQVMACDAFAVPVLCLWPTDKH